MITKIVITEKGLQLSNDIFKHPSDELPPFIEEAKQPKNPPILPLKLNKLFEDSNGYLDR